MKTKESIPCEQCKKVFDKLKTEIKRYPHRNHFCSKNCYFAYIKKKEIICEFCKKSYLPINTRNYKTNFCSMPCHRANTIAKHDLTGKIVGRCTVIRIDEESPRSSPYWLLKCSCGETFSCRHRDVEKGRVYECPNCIFRRSQYYIGGKKYGRLSVQEKWEWRISPTNGKRFRYWWCICECGNELWINANSIIRSSTLSCGCYLQKLNSRYANETLYPIRHGLSGKRKDKIYHRWVTLMGKCYNPKYPSYHNWGNEGYELCEQWRNNYKSFHDWMMENGFSEELTIDIKDGKKVFSPETCYLIDIHTHHNRMRHKTHLKSHGIEYKGETHTLKEWATIYNIPYQGIQSRWAKCKDIDRCLNGTWNDGSGCHMRRLDISDDQIKKMYEDGFSIVEIDEFLGFTASFSRLHKMGVKFRPRKYRQAVINENIIAQEISKGTSLDQLMEKCSYSHKRYLKFKVISMGYKVEGNKIHS